MQIVLDWEASAAATRTDDVAVSYDADVDAWELVVDAPALAAALLHAEGPIPTLTDMGHRSQRIGEKARCTFAGVADQSSYVPLRPSGAIRALTQPRCVFALGRCGGARRRVHRIHGARERNEQCARRCPSAHGAVLVRGVPRATARPQRTTAGVRPRRADGWPQRRLAARAPAVWGPAGWHAGAAQLGATPLAAHLGDRSGAGAERA
jgi:hypothetical protein